MDFYKVRENLQQLEESLLKLVKDFEASNQLHVEAINLETLREMNDGGKIVVGVRVSVDIGRKYFP